MNAIQDLSDINADPDNWEWKAKSKAEWKPAGEDWQGFNTKWYGTTESQSASPFLSLEPLPTDLDTSISSSIFIRKSYLMMFDTLWTQAIESKRRRGVIITGQPGTGKMLFQYYLLVRLLQRKQVVLFSPTDNRIFLFYHNKVYTVDANALNNVENILPHPISSSHAFIWSLFDIREPKEPNKFLTTLPCFPVQTTSPNPVRYKTWDKERRPLLTGLPLWTRDELTQGLKLQAEYQSLLGALHEVYGCSSPDSSKALDAYSGARELLQEHYSEEDSLQPSPEDALDYLLGAAIDRFGYSARDVFSAVFDYDDITLRHMRAFNGVTYQKLYSTVLAIYANQNAEDKTSHEILAMSPVYRGPFKSVLWDVYFKSEWVSRSVARKLAQEEESEIRRGIRKFRNISEARGLARQLHEPLAHRKIANVTGGIWPLINMKSNGADSPHLALVQDPFVLVDVQFIKVQRKIVKFRSITELSSRLENNSYYIPIDPNFSLFDSFTIELEDGNRSAILWVLQMITSHKHKGSAKGYQNIREIIAILKDKLREDRPPKKIKMATGQAIPEPLVQVRYLLVIPRYESEYESQDLQWDFPKGWNQNYKNHDHRGKVYCLEVPVT